DEARWWPACMSASAGAARSTLTHQDNCRLVGHQPRWPHFWSAHKQWFGVRLLLRSRKIAVVYSPTYSTFVAAVEEGKSFAYGGVSSVALAPAPSRWQIACSGGHGARRSAERPTRCQQRAARAEEWRVWRVQGKGTPSAGATRPSPQALKWKVP